MWRQLWEVPLHKQEVSKALKDGIINKIKNNAGETIGETLIALLIAALALTMLAGALSSATSIILRGKTVMQDYYEANNRLAERNDAAKTGKLTVTISDNAGALGSLSSEDEIKMTVEDVPYYSNDELGRTPVIYYSLTSYTTDDGDEP